MVASEPGDQTERVLELIWASTTAEVLGVRSRVESWPAPGSPVLAASPPASKPRVSKLPGV